jgi:hypothetical protein
MTDSIRQSDTGKTLLMPPLPPALQDVFPELTGLPVRQGDASHNPITLASRNVTAAGNERNGVREVRLHSVRVMTDLRSAPAASITTSPGFLQRTLDGITERVSTFDVPAVVWQWTAHQDATLQLDWVTDIGWEPPDRSTPTPPQWSCGDRWLFVLAGAPSRAALFCFDRKVDWQVEQIGPALHVHATTQIPNGEHLSFAAVGGHTDSNQLERAARSLDRLAPLVRGRVGTARRVERERLRVLTPDPALNDAWRWAVHRLEGGSAGADPVWTAMASLALGDFAAVRAGLAFLGEPAHRIQPETTPLYLALIARYLAATADLDYVRAEWPRVLAAADLYGSILSDSQTTAYDAGIWASAFQDLAIAAEGVGQREDQSRFRNEAQPGRERLDGLLPWLDRVAGAELTDDWGVRAIPRFVFGLLGLEQDAPRNRVTLRPAIPYDWQFLTVDNLRVGEASFSVRYTRTGEQHTFELAPTSGSVPLRLIFEPRIRADRIERVLIDGRPAVLDVRRSDDRLVCPMQVELDSERSVMIEAK